MMGPSPVLPLLEKDIYSLDSYGARRPVTVEEDETETQHSSQLLNYSSDKGRSGSSGWEWWDAQQDI